jgi:hypothetical protein
VVASSRSGRRNRHGIHAAHLLVLALSSGVELDDQVVDPVGPTP